MRVRGLTVHAMRALGVVSPVLREMVPLQYQWTAPSVLDDAPARAHFGIEPTPWDEVCRRTLVGVA